MNHTFFDGHDELYHHAKFGEHRTTRAGCRCENVVCFFCFFLFVFLLLCHAPSPEGRAFEGCIVRTRYWSKIIGRFRRGLDQMAPLQSAKFKTAFWGQYHTSVRKDSVANYGWIWTLFSVFVRGGDALCNALNISQICL